MGITVGDIAGTLSMDADLNIKNGVTSVLIWSLFPLITSRISLKNKKFRDFLEGSATVFVRDGKILEGNLRKEKYTIDEFLEQLRKKDIFEVDDIEFATLESNGDLSVLLKKFKQPITYGDLHPNAAVEEKEPKTIIMDGDILEHPLTQLGLNPEWVEMELNKRKLHLKDVFLAQIDTFGNMKIDLYNDQLESPKNKDRLLTMVTLEKCVSDFEFLAVTAVSDEARVFYKNTAFSLEETETILRPILK